MKQYEAVILTLENGGSCYFRRIKLKEVFKIEECEWKTKHPFCWGMRRIVQQRKEIYK